MTFSFDSKTFAVTEFFTYPTCVIDRICEFEEYLDKPNPRKADEDVKEFFNKCLKYAEEKLGRHLMDNKVAMKVVVPETGQFFYVGYKDNIYAIGLALNPYMTGKCIDI